MRTWLYQTLINAPTLQAVLEDSNLEDRVSQGESLDTRLITKPFLVYTIGNSTNEHLSDYSLANRQFFTIFVHDEPADYTKIDDVVKVVKNLLVGASDPASKVMIVRHLETSRDLDDQTMGTILRYIRFQAIMEE